jgi:hypothetical protein
MATTQALSMPAAQVKERFRGGRAIPMRIGESVLARATGRMTELTFIGAEIDRGKNDSGMGMYAVIRRSLSVN